MEPDKQGRRYQSQIKVRVEPERLEGAENEVASVRLLTTTRIRAGFGHPMTVKLPDGQAEGTQLLTPAEMFADREGLEVEIVLLE